MLANMAKTPTHPFVPYVTVNGKPICADSKCPLFFTEVCAAITAAGGTAPAVCSAPQELPTEPATAPACPSDW